MQEAVEVTSGHIAAPRPTWPWIHAVYADLVGGIPDLQQRERWITAAQAGASHREIACELLQSDEYCRAQISALYRSLLDREADREGLEAWTLALKSGIALQDIIVGLCDSFEYKANHPGGPAFVESLYQRLLRRASDPAGKATWLAALQDRASTWSVIREFLCSAEYCTQRVTELHERTLGREPDPANLLERVVAVMQGTALQQIVLGLVTSTEYITRARPEPAELPAPAPATTDRRSIAGAAAPQSRHGTDPDADALALVRAGDVTGALELLMQRHGAAVYRYCRVALDDAALADDVQQQIFIEAFRDLPRFACRSTVRTWLLGIARHRVLDAAKLRRRAQSHVEDATTYDPPDYRPLPDEWIDETRLQSALIACLDKLDEPVRTTILLRYQQGLTYDEIAEICGDNPGTLQARVTRALRRLRDHIESHIRDRR